jgi:hypothetical protein
MVESISDEILVSDILDELAAPRLSRPEEEPQGLNASMLPDAIEAGLYLCSPAVFDRLTELALQLPYFTLGQGMQLVAADGKLGALDTQGYKWFAVETADQLRHHAQQLSAQDYATPPMMAATAPRAPKMTPPLPQPHTVASPPPAVPLAPARTARRRYHILALDDGGDFSDKPCFLSGGAGMLTTAHDYLRFAQCLLNDGELEVRSAHTGCCCPPPPPTHTHWRASQWTPPRPPPPQIHRLASSLSLPLANITFLPSNCVPDPPFPSDLTPPWPPAPSVLPLQGVRLLSRKTVEFMRRNQLPLEGTGSTRR